MLLRLRHLRRQKKLADKKLTEQAGLAQCFVDYDRYCVGEVQASDSGFEDWDSVGAVDSIGDEVSA